MSLNTLKLLVLHEAESPDPSLLEILPSLPQVRVTGQGKPQEDLFRQQAELAPDVVLVDLGHEDAVPKWLENLDKLLPETTVMVCAHNREPDFLIRIIHLGIREFLPLPLGRSELEEALERVRHSTAKKRQISSEGRRGQLVAVTGLKGGMGATAVAVNLAVALAEDHPGRVALMDLGRPFPDVANFLDQKNTASLMDLAEHGGHLDATMVMKALQQQGGKLAVLHGGDNLEVLDSKVLEKVWQILRTLFDWVIIDLSYWLDDLYLKTLQEADQVLLLTDLLVPNLDNLKKTWQLYNQWNLEKEKVKVIVNRYVKDNGVGLADVERIQHLPIFSTLPSDTEALTEAINHGVPLNEMAPRSKLYRALKRMAEELTESSPMPTYEQAPGPKKNRRRFLFF